MFYVIYSFYVGSPKEYRVHVHVLQVPICKCRTNAILACPAPMCTPTKPSLSGGGGGDDDGVIIFAGGIDFQEMSLGEFPLNFWGITNLQSTTFYTSISLQAAALPTFLEVGARRPSLPVTVLRCWCYLVGGGGLSFVPIAAARVADSCGLSVWYAMQCMHYTLQYGIRCRWPWRRLV